MKTFMSLAVVFLLLPNAFAQKLNYAASINIAEKTPYYEGITTELHGGDDYLRSHLFINDGNNILHIDRGTSELVLESLLQPYDIASGATFEAITDTLPDSGTGLSGFTYQSFVFNNDGTKLFLIASGFNDEYDGAILQYDLSNPYDVFDMEYKGKFKHDITFSYDDDIAFNKDGTLLYLLNDINENIHIFSLNIPFDITQGVTETNTFDYDPAIFAVKMKFTPDGKTMFLVEFYNSGIHQYQLNTPFDLTGSVNYVGYYKFPMSGLANVSMDIKNDGTKFYILADDSPLYEFNFSDQYIFKETVADNGAVQGEMIISLNTGSFVNAGGSLIHGVHYSIDNLPTGLSPSLNVATSGSMATLTLSGNASSHGLADIIDGLVFSFEDIAFNGMTAAGVENAISFNTGLGVSFDEKPSIDFADTLSYGETNVADVLDVDAFLKGFGVVDEDITYSISGTDAGAFSINANSGVLQFNATPDFENPTDNNGDNYYVLNITATYIADSTKTLVVKVTDKIEHLIYASDIHIGTAAYDDVALDANSQMDQLSGFAFAPQDSVVFITNYQNKSRINAYRLNGSTLDAGYSFKAGYNLPEGFSSRGIRFSDDGTKLFTFSTGTVYQYALDSPFDLAQITYEGELDISLWLSLSNISDYFFSPDGTKLYFISGNSGNNFGQLALLNPFDITGTVTIDIYENFNATGTGSMYLSQNGLNFFTTNGGLETTISEYRLNVPYDFSQGYTFVNSITNKDIVNSSSINVNSSEEKLYFGDYQLNKLLQFSINSPRGFAETIANNGSVSGNGTFTLTGDMSFVNPSGTLTQGIHYTISNLPSGLSSTISVNASGSAGVLNITGNASPHTSNESVSDLIFTFYDGAFAGAAAADVENTLTASSGFSITFDSKPGFSVPEIIYHGSGKTNDVADIDAFLEGASAVDEYVTYSISGTDASFFTIDDASGVLSFNSVPYYDNPLDNGADNIYDLTITASASSDSSRNVQVIIVPFEKTLSYSIPMDLQADADSLIKPSLYVGNREQTSTGLAFSKDGSKVFVVGDTRNRIIQYSLSTPFDVSTGAYDRQIDITGVQSNTQGIAINSDGTKMFIVGYSPSSLHEYKLATPNDLSGGITLIKSIDLTDYMYLGAEIAVSPDGSKLFILGTIENAVLQFSLNLPFSISGGLEYETEYTVGSARQGMAFSPDGTRMFITGPTVDAIQEYSLETPYDLSGTVNSHGSYNYPGELSVYEYNPQALAVNNDGTKVYVLGTSLDSILQISLAPRYAFEETIADDGTVEGTMLINISGDQFVNAGGTLDEGTHFIINNAPSGLSPVMTVDASGTLATLTFNSNAFMHEEDDTVDSLNFTFTDAAFVSGVADGIDQSTNYSSSLGVLFITNMITGITNYSEENHILYPNPTTGWVFLPVSQDYEVLDALGQPVSAGNAERIDLSTLPNGMYIIKTETLNEVVVKF